MNTFDFLGKGTRFVVNAFLSMTPFLPNLKIVIDLIVSVIIIGTSGKLVWFYIESRIKSNYIKKKVTLEKLKEEIIKTTPRGFFTIGNDSFPNFEKIAAYLLKCYRYSRNEKKQLKSYKEKYSFLVKNGRTAGDIELNDLCCDARKFFIILIDQKIFKLMRF